MTRRVRQILQSEAGNYMITTLIGALVMLVVIGAIASGILGIALFQKIITDRSDVTKEAALTDSTLRSDILWASSITATDGHRLELTVPGQNGRCRVATWAIAPAGGGKATVDVTVVDYPSADSTVNPVRCAGEPSAPSTQTIITDADPASSFTYANAGGRQLVYTGGTASLAGPEAAPGGVPAKVWSSPKLAAVALTTTVANSTDRKREYRIAQTADNLSVIQEAADAPTHFVPEGDLTALP
ncbi:hypothetical protein Achl_4141 (plasmid) [Pseudarthrobacter chlorophenolicus A6]|uniref:Uncharacterized protein n=1 Tax=Pseudarthrobacter chlorophenolicus (strain ATCC 700700 / DSM 12829 / CIP 107037 / JCM 12360 / KCTC 9906 / NCIMB 13794 / A6) TaxID=452863 RepID=B8HI45_PSECP|nr:hypothetical protein [Pseudarthrobacter chlorophenolicus]ACL42092.1 hypothetical protein Achl_4141 [Pseudarthrobacter chlorophenolicus A6]SDQ13319.1 hypothetical protein SAMN04489738_0200 [Pseudarthrobacter chlorophenolicus]